jgi:hypothetical protein
MVIADLPRAGLANLLYIWAKAFIFSSRTGQKLYVNGFNQIKLGPVLRGERTKRNYRGFFKYNTNYIGISLYKLFKSKKILYEIDIKSINRYDLKDKLVVYNQIPRVSEGDIFQDLYEFRKEIRIEFFKMLSVDILKKIKTLQKPVISVHVRRGDFKQRGWTKTNDYYINKILEVREFYGYECKVFVFCDAFEYEIKEILELKNVELIQNKDDILDMIQISMSEYIITTPLSSFSMWAVFLSNEKPFV